MGCAIIEQAGSLPISSCSRIQAEGVTALITSCRVSTGTLDFIPTWRPEALSTWDRGGDDSVNGDDRSLWIRMESLDFYSIGRVEGNEIRDSFGHMQFFRGRDFILSQKHVNFRSIDILRVFSF